MGKLIDYIFIMVMAGIGLTAAVDTYKLQNLLPMVQTVVKEDNSYSSNWYIAGAKLPACLPTWEIVTRR